MLLAHYRLVVHRFGADRGTVLMRRYACCYAQGLPGARLFCAAVSKVRAAEEFLAAVEESFPITAGRCP